MCMFQYICSAIFKVYRCIAQHLENKNNKNIQKGPRTYVSWMTWNIVCTEFWFGTNLLKL